MIDSGVAYNKLASLDSAEEIRHFLAHQGIKESRFPLPVVLFLDT